MTHDCKILYGLSTGMGIGVYYFQRLENNELFVWVKVRVGVLGRGVWGRREWILSIMIGCSA